MVKLCKKLPAGNSDFLLECVSEGILTPQEEEQLHGEGDKARKAMKFLGFIISKILKDGDYYDSFLELLREYKLQDMATTIEKTPVTQKDLNITEQSYQTSVWIGLLCLLNMSHLLYLITTIINGTTGWIPKLFIGITQLSSQ